MKNFLCLFLILSLLLTCGCTASRGDGEPSETPDETPAETPEETPDETLDETPDETPADSGTNVPPPTKEALMASVGSFENTMDGVTVRVAFRSIPESWYKNQPILYEGTLTYTNDTGEQLTRYLHANIDICGDHYVLDEITHSDTPVIEPSEEYETLTEEAPLLLSLAPGESVTVNFSVLYPAHQIILDAPMYLTFGLSEGEEYDFFDTSYRFCFLVKD